MTSESVSMMSSNTTAPPPHSLEVSPDSVLSFELERGESVPKCTMTLKHLGKTEEAIAFKVKTTQPRRYLVRPNQGLIFPNKSESVSILLVEKDKQVLLQSYDRLGQSALDHSKDKFLVQTLPLNPSESTDLQAKQSKQLTDALTALWNQSQSKPDIYNKKLHVKHVVIVDQSQPNQQPQEQPISSTQQQTTTQQTVTQPPNAEAQQDRPSLESMSPQQVLEEISNLRRKYDELVAFSVNLTAERDILNNTLEQTKRDLNREIQTRQNSKSPKEEKKGSKGIAFVWQVLVVALASFIAGGMLLGECTMGDILAILPFFGKDDEKVLNLEL